MFIHLIDNIWSARNKVIYEKKDVHAIEADISSRRGHVEYQNSITKPIQDTSKDPEKIYQRDNIHDHQNKYRITSQTMNLEGNKTYLEEDKRDSKELEQNWR